MPRHRKPQGISRIVTKVRSSDGDGRVVSFPINPDIKEKDDPTGLNQFPVVVAEGCLIKPDAPILIYTSDDPDKLTRSLVPTISGIFGLSRTCEICPHNYEGKRREEIKQCLAVYHKERL